MIRLLVILAVILGLWGIFSAGWGMAHGNQYAAHAVADFHRRISDSKFDEIYAEASARFRAAVTKEEFMKIFPDIRRKLGAYQRGSGKQKGMKVDYSFGKTSVYVIYESQYEKGPVTEWFRFLVSGGRAQLERYDVDSKVINLKP